MVAAQEKFTGQAVPELLAAMRGIARREGRDFEEVLEEAMWDYLKNKLPQNVRPEVMAHYYASLERNRLLMELLAKS